MRIGYSMLLVGLIALIAIMSVSVFTADATLASVAHIPINGPITIDGQSGWSTGASSSNIVDYIEQADESGAKMILLEINSPGGTVVATEEIADAVARAKTPTVAWIREVGASGGYWVASEADYIIASRMSITGSVGVIASYLEFGEFLEDYNITYRQLTGGEYKDVGNPFTEMSEDEQELVQEKIDRIHQFFIQAVAENRNLTEDQVDEVSSGIYYLGIEAYELGLVDELGGRYEVEQYLEQELGAKPTYRKYEYNPSLFEELALVQSPLMGLSQGFSIRT